MGSFADGGSRSVATNFGPPSTSSTARSFGVGYKTSNVSMCVSSPNSLNFAASHSALSLSYAVPTLCGRAESRCMYSRISCGLGMALNFSSHWRSSCEDSAEKPESTGSSLEVGCNQGNAAGMASNSATAQTIRLIGSSDGLRNRLLRQNFAQHKISNHRETCPFPLVRLDRVNNSENEVQDPSAHSPKPDQPESTEKRHRSRLTRTILQVLDNRT